MALVLDHNGIGSAISELFELPRLLTGPGPQYKLVKINITGGLNPSRAEGGYNVPNTIIVFFVAQSLSVREIEDLRQAFTSLHHQDELPNFKVKNSDDGKDACRTWREAIHDDLVLSVAIGSLYAEKSIEREYEHRKRWWGSNHGPTHPCLNFFDSYYLN